jgi:hypothetical protein
MNNDHAQPTRRDLIVKAGLLTLSGAVATSAAAAQLSIFEQRSARIRLCNLNPAYSDH